MLLVVRNNAIKKFTSELVTYDQEIQQLPLEIQKEKLDAAIEN